MVNIIHNRILVSHRKDRHPDPVIYIIVNANKITEFIQMSQAQKGKCTMILHVDV